MKKAATPETAVTDIVHENLALAFNEWMRRYTDEPERYAREYQEVALYLAEKAAGREPSYGENCAAYLQSILRELHAAGLARAAA